MAPLLKLPEDETAQDDQGEVQVVSVHPRHDGRPRRPQPVHQLATALGEGARDHEDGQAQESGAQSDQEGDGADRHRQQAAPGDLGEEGQDAGGGDDADREEGGE